MDIDTTVWYYIVNVNSNRMLEVPGDGISIDDRLRNGVIIKQGDLYNPADPSAPSPWALWQFVKGISGTQLIFNRGSGRCLAIQNGSLDKNVPGWQYQVNPQMTDELWWITDVPSDNGNVYLQNVKSSRYLEILNSGTTKGVQCQQYDDSPPDRPGAQWLLKPTKINTTPQLTHGNLDKNQIHRNRGAKSAGILHGENLSIGSTVLAKKGAVTWTGLIEDNHAPDLSIFWTFSVQFKSSDPDPIQDDTLTVTVTNTAQQTSNTVPPDPPASVVP
jgi:hypothetical protein